VPMGSDGAAWAMDPAVAYKTYFAPQGIGADLIATKYGFSRNEWMPMRWNRSAAPRRRGRKAASGTASCR
jgi:hypothetical protein